MSSHPSQKRLQIYLSTPASLGSATAVMRGLTKLVPLALGAAAFGRLVRMRAGTAKATPRAAKAVPPTAPVVRDPCSETFPSARFHAADAVDARGAAPRAPRRGARVSRIARPRVPLDDAERTRLTTRGSHASRFVTPRSLLRRPDATDDSCPAVTHYRNRFRRAAHGAGSRICAFSGLFPARIAGRTPCPPPRARRRLVLAPGRHAVGPDRVGALRAENAYAEAHLEHVQPLVEKLYAEIKSSIQESDDDAPFAWGPEHEYFVRTVEGSAYPVVLRRNRARGPSAEPAPEPEVVLE